MRWLVVGVCLSSSMFCGQAWAQAWSDTSAIYTVQVPVAGQGGQDRQAAAGEGLRQILTRVTGLLSVPRNAVVADALANPERYYSAFDFITADSAQAGVDSVRIVFQPKAVQELVAAAQLPIWWEARPSILAWVVVQDGAQRQLLSAADDHPLTSALKQRATQRGLSLQQPLMDLTDSMEVTSADVWGRVSTTIERASRRYEPGMILIGRFRAEQVQGITRYTGQWEIWQGTDTKLEMVEQADVLQAGMLGADTTAQYLIERFAVLPRGLRQVQVEVRNIEDMSDYASLLQYLDSLTFLSAVDVQSVQDKTLRLALHSQAREEQLEFLLTQQERLQTILNVGPERAVQLAFSWRG